MLHILRYLFFTTLFGFMIFLPSVMADERVRKEERNILASKLIPVINMLMESSTLQFTQRYLDGKIFYWVVYDDFGYNNVGIKWNMASFSFHGSDVDFQEYDTQDSDIHVFQYSVRGNGILSITDGKHTNEFTIISSTEEYLYVKDENGEYSYFFFNEAKARVFRDNQNNISDKGFTVSLISENPWYAVEEAENKVYCNGKFIFNESGELTVKYYENGKEEIFNGEYEIEDGLLILAHDGKIEKEALQSTLQNRIDALQKTYDENSGELKNTMHKVYFRSYTEMLSFADKREVDCHSDIPQ